MNPVRSILRRATRDDKSLNILCCPTHERQQSSFEVMDHTFWMLDCGFKKWNYKYAPLPSNFHIIPHDKDRPIPAWLDIDVVISQSKYDQFHTLQPIAKRLNVPFINVEHTIPPASWSQEQIQGLSQFTADINVFVNSHQRRGWGYEDTFGIVNHTGIDTDVFVPLQLERDKKVLSICNDWKNRDIFCGFKLWQEVTGHPRPIMDVHVLGDTPGLSKPAKDTNELVTAYNKASVYLNTTLASSLPTVILEAMACGCPVVSTKHCGIDETIIEHGVNGFCSNDPSELRRYCQMLIQNEDLAKKMGEAGRKTILEKFDKSLFIQKWEQILEEAIS